MTLPALSQRKKLAPRVVGAFDQEMSDPAIFREMGEHGLFGLSFSEAYGGSGANYVAYGFAARELGRVDSAYRSMFSVQSSLVMYPIHAYGSEAQKKRYLPGLAADELVGCFGLTEPDAGSDPGGMRTRAAKVGDHNRISGSKTWISNAPFADRSSSGRRVKRMAERYGALCWIKGAKGLSVSKIKGKINLRRSLTDMILLDDVEVGEDALLPGAEELAGPFGCLNRARFGIGWGVLGAAEFCFHASRRYGLDRLQFGTPLAGRQLYQK